MADIPTGGGSTIHVGTTDTGTPSTLSLITIAKRAMRVVGTQTDRGVQMVALEAIQDCINETNIRRAFDWTVTKDTDVTLVADQREYSIPDGAFGVKELVLVKDSETPEEIVPLGYIDWDQLQRFFRQHRSSFPLYWSARDVFMDRKVELANPPDSGTVSEGWKLRIYYRTAISRPPINDTLLQINGPEVLSTCIQRYVEYRLHVVYSEPHDPRRREAYREYRDLLNGLGGMENRARPGSAQLRLHGALQGATGYYSRHGWLGPHGRT